MKTPKIISHSKDGAHVHIIYDNLSQKQYEALIALLDQAFEIVKAPVSIPVADAVESDFGAFNAAGGGL